MDAHFLAESKVSVSNGDCTELTSVAHMNTFAHLDSIEDDPHSMKF